MSKREYAEFAAARLVEREPGLADLEAEAQGELAEFSRLVELVYLGPLEESPWSTFLEALRLGMAAMAVTLIVEPPSSEGPGYMLNARGSQTSRWRTSYQERFFASDPFVNLPEGRPVTLSEFVPQDQYRSSEFYLLYMKPIGVRDVLGADVRAESGILARLRVTRAEREADFGPADRRLCALLIPHLRQSLEIFTRLSRIASERLLYAGTLNQLAVGTIILDGQGRILDRDRIAEELLAQSDGLVALNGVLSLSDRAASARLHEAVRKITEHERKGEKALVEAIRAERPSGKRDLGLIVKEAPRPQYLDGQHVPAIVVFINDPERHTVMAPAALGKLFGLTPAEASLCVLLGDGLTLDEAAHALSISRNTARAHLRSIFAKTGVTRQTMLVRLIVTSLAQLGSEEAR